MNAKDQETYTELQGLALGWARLRARYLEMREDLLEHVAVLNAQIEDVDRYAFLVQMFLRDLEDEDAERRR